MLGKIQDEKKNLGAINSQKMDISLELYERKDEDDNPIGFDCTITLDEFVECCQKIWSEMMIPV